ncbi:glycosyltransferase [Actinocorallia longicatena]|uniref:Glycosyltransferase family 1 protein n=1 Tax=Actinocorallia longicatena TaxID=111803 RepID=A0ABP6Q380_9ACTN
MRIAMIAVDRVGQVSALARELGKQGHQVTVHTRREQPGKRRTTLAAGVTVDPVPAGPERPLHGGDLLPHLAEFGNALAERWTRNSPDVAHAHDWPSGLAALTASHRLAGPDPRPASAAIADLLDGRRLPLLQTYGTLAAHHPDVDPAAQARVERALGRAAIASTVSCGEGREDLVRLGVPRRSIAVVPTGVDVAEFSEIGPIAPRGARARLLLLTGPGEKAHLAVRALARVPGAELVVAGGPAPADLETDPAAHALRMLAEHEGVEDRVIILGRVTRKQTPKLIRSADLVLALQDHDPFGTVALEAMACGIPVIAHDSGGHSDTVLDNVTGLLIPTLPPVALARRIRDLLADPVRREALGIAAADRARSRHSWDRIARETAAVYAKLA